MRAAKAQRALPFEQATPGRKPRGAEQASGKAAAMVAIERDNPSSKAVLPKNYGRPQLDKQRLGELVDLIGTIGFAISYDVALSIEKLKSEGVRTYWGPRA